MQFCQKCFRVIDLFHKLCHTIVTKTVPDIVPERFQ